MGYGIYNRQAGAIVRRSWTLSWSVPGRPEPRTGDWLVPAQFRTRAVPGAAHSFFFARPWDQKQLPRARKSRTIPFLCVNDFVHSHGVTAVLKYRSKVWGSSV